jgi:hypothetical protein
MTCLLRLSCTSGVWVCAWGSTFGCLLETSGRVKATCYFFRFECRVWSWKKCIFNCFSRASFGCLDVRLIFQVDYNQNASKFTNRLEKQVGVLTLGLLIRLWNVAGCWNGHMHMDSTFLKTSMRSGHSLSICKVRVQTIQVLWWCSVTCQSCHLLSGQRCR